MILLIALALLVGIGRFLIPGHDISLPGTYESFAHIVVGVFIAVGVIGQSKETRLTAWICLAVTTLIEILAFLYLVVL